MKTTNNFLKAVIIFSQAGIVFFGAVAVVILLTMWTVKASADEVETPTHEEAQTLVSQAFDMFTPEELGEGLFTGLMPNTEEDNLSYKMFLGDAYSKHFFVNDDYDYNEIHRTYGLEIGYDDTHYFGYRNFVNSYYTDANTIYYNYGAYNWQSESGIFRAQVGATAGVSDGYELDSFNYNGYTAYLGVYTDLIVSETIGVRATLYGYQVATVSFFMVF